MKVIDDIDIAKLRKRSEALCAREEHCDYDIEQKLFSWGASPKQVAIVIEYLHEADFLNDERYARLYCVGKNRQLKWGKVKIAYQLRMKRVEEHAIAVGLDAIDEEEYRNGLLKLAQQKWELIREADRYVKEGKVCGFLQGKGYEMYEIRNVIKLL